jgi:hypothetical protein
MKGKKRKCTYLSKMGSSVVSVLRGRGYRMVILAKSTGAAELPVAWLLPRRLSIARRKVALRDTATIRGLEPTLSLAALRTTETVPAAGFAGGP